MPGPDPVDLSRVNPLGTQVETANASMAHHQNRSPGRERRGPGDRCLYCVPSSCTAALPGTTWRPLIQPATYPWSLLWRAADDSGHVQAVVSCSRATSKRPGWLTPAPTASG